jgi:uncharacterized protein (DUF433 family)
MTKSGDSIRRGLKQALAYVRGKGRKSRYRVSHPRIEMNPDIMGGKPVIRGTRVPVELVRRKLRAGMSPKEILADHPRLTAEDIQAVQRLDRT